MSAAIKQAAHSNETLPSPDQVVDENENESTPSQIKKKRRERTYVAPRKFHSQCKTVKVPAQFEPLFLQAETLVKKYYARLYQSPKTGIVSIENKRYLLLRASALSVDFFESIVESVDEAPSGAISASSNKRGSSKGNAAQRAQLELQQQQTANQDFVRRLLYDFSFALGTNDANTFSKLMNLRSPVEALAAGPVTFTYSGWATVSLFPSSAPSPDEYCFFFYDHPYSFEAHSWLAKYGDDDSKRPSFPVCMMSAGYSCGWSAACFGVPLVGVEVLCKARGMLTTR